MRTMLRLAACLLLALAWIGPAAATPSFDGCTGFLDPQPGRQLPMQQVITTPGVWCLRQDLVVDYAGPGAMIDIQADDVTVDCKGFRIEALPDAGHPVAIYSFTDPARLTVRNCRISGFQYGISLGSSTGSSGGKLVEDNVFIGVDSAIGVAGPGSIVRRNRIHGTQYGTAIIATSAESVTDNVIYGVTANTSEAVGLTIVNPRGTAVHDNIVRGLRSTGEFNKATALRVIEHQYQLTHAGATIRDNVFLGAGADQTVLMECTDDTSRYFDNQIGGVGAGSFNSCTDAGGNEITP